MSYVKVLIIDDSIEYRYHLKHLVQSIDGLNVVALAGSDREGLTLNERHQPDLVILDLNIPGLGGLGLIPKLLRQHKDCKVFAMTCASSPGDALKARALGAFNTMPRQDLRQLQKDGGSFLSALRLKLRPLLEFMPTATDILPSKTLAPTPLPDAFSQKPKIVSKPQKVRIVAIGVSTGGPTALSNLFSQLDEDFPVPIVVVLHMPAYFTHALVQSLAKNAKLNILLADEAMPLKPGSIYIAPGGMHITVGRDKMRGPILHLRDTDPVNSCKPSVDVLFQSVAQIFRGAALGVMMTGMGNDGAQGSLDLVNKGATVIAQDRASSVVYGMVDETKKLGAISAEYPLDELGQQILMRVTLSEKCASL